MPPPAPYGLSPASGNRARGEACHQPTANSSPTDKATVPIARRGLGPIPKSETNSKSKRAISKRRGFRTLATRDSDLFRISRFGFRATGTAGSISSSATAITNPPSNPTTASGSCANPNPDFDPHSPILKPAAADLPVVEPAETAAPSETRRRSPRQSPAAATAGKAAK